MTDRPGAAPEGDSYIDPYRTLIQSSEVGFCFIQMCFDEAGLAEDYIFLEVNPAFEAQTGLKNAVGKRMRELAPAHEAHWFDIYGRVAVTGAPAHFEEEAAALGRWYHVHAFRVGPPGAHKVAILFEDITARKRAEETLRESEERQAFLLKLSDVLWPIADAAEIQVTTTRLLGAHLDVDRAMYAEVEGERGAETGTIRGQYVRPSAEAAVAPFPERFTYGDYGERRMAARHRGELLVVADIEADPGADDVERENWRVAGVRAAVVAPLVKGGRLVAEFGIHCVAPRAWTEAELSLVRDVGERTWAAAERARAEAALRESEERLRLIVENARDYAIFTMALDARITDWREGAEAVFGYARDEIIGREADILFTPEDNEAGEPEKERALAAATGKAPNVRWHVCKDGRRVFIEGVCTALHDGEGKLTGFLKVGRDATERHAAQERQNMLLAELQHRVRNTLAVVRSITRRTAENSSDVEEMASHLEGRIDAFARVQAAVTRNPEGLIDLRLLIEDELLAYATHESNTVRLEGPDVGLRPKLAETISLAIHELATNAVKHGALAEPSGRLRVAWRLGEGADGRRLELEWDEGRVQLAAEAPSHEGFGTELLLRVIPYELRAESALEFRPCGICYTMSAPLDAPPER